MVFALVALIGGGSLMTAAGLFHRRGLDQSMDDLLGMVPIAPVDATGDDSVGPVTGRAVDLAGEFLTRTGRAGNLAGVLERARIPLRPAEFLIVQVAVALGAAALAVALTHSLLLAATTGCGAAVLSVRLVRRRITKRRKAFEAQLPDALSLVASSLSAGHTFLRAIQMMCEESEAPLSEEFGRIVAETRLGDTVVDALARMAQRLQIRDLDMVVQAIRIQQTVGGRLSDLLHTLADFIRARDEIRREVMVLTAEGRMSAYVLTGLVPFLFLLMRVVNPGYVKPLYHGGGLILLISCGVSVLAGMFVILRMVKIDV